MAGGGGSTTTTAAIDPDIKARVLPALDQATRQYLGEQANPQAIVANQQYQRDALVDQHQFAKDVAETGISPQVEQDLRNLQGQQLAGGQGTLGSARADRARQAGLADRSLQLRQADLDTRRQGYEGAVTTAGQERALQQEAIDAPHTSAQRYFGYLAGAPQGQSTTQSGGGGK